MPHSQTTEFPIRPGRGILIVDTQGFGDVVSSLSLLKAVCRWSSERWPVCVLLHSPSRFEVIRAENLNVFPLYMQSYLGCRGMIRLSSELSGKVDLVLGLPEISAKKLIMLRYALGAKYLIAESPSSSRRWMSTHVELDWTESFLRTQDKLAAALGITTPLPPPEITITPVEAHWAQSIVASACLNQNGPLIGMHCASAVPAKAWPAVNFGVVVRLLKKQFAGLSVVSFGSQDERRSSDQARQAAGAIRWFDGTGELTIRQSLSLLARCDLLISGDTGLMHMAAAVGTKTLSIFGPTSPLRRAPLHTGGLAVYPRTWCHPCYRGDWKPCACVQLISAEAVATLAGSCLRPNSLSLKYPVFDDIGVLRKQRQLESTPVSFR
jgi:ADP-heptose:LPS heptosyltransferase